MAKEKYIGEALLKDKPTTPLSFKFKDKSVKTKHIDDKAVTNGQIDDNAVTERTILDSNVTNSKIANGAITSDKIGAGEVKNSNIGESQVTSDKIGAGEVKTDNIAGKAVTTAKIDDGAVNTTQIHDRAVTSAKIRLQEVKTENIKDQNVTTPKLADGNVTWGKLSQDAKNSISDMVDDAADVITRRLMRDVNTIMSDYRPIEISGDVSNAADEEDLTSVNIGGTEVIKLKDKVYAPTIYSGLGKKYLRKNMVDGVNVLTQEMISDANTIYHIQYDYMLSENITVPANCVLEFDGGSIKSTNNSVITGTGTIINTDVTYNIFNAALGGGFILPYVDVRWFGGISDYNEKLGTGTDNSFAFERAINVIGKYYNGLYIRLSGQYLIGTDIETVYDVNIWGSHFNSRNLLNSTDVSDVTSPSLIAIGAGVTAFKMVGRNKSNARSRYCNFNIKNIKVVGDRTTSKFILFSAQGAPARYSVIEEVEAKGILYFLEISADDANTMLAGLTATRCYCYSSGKFIYAYSTKTGEMIPRTVSNLIIENSTIEHNGERCIDIGSGFGNVIIKNNILEGQLSPIYVKASVIEISDNYFESNTGDYVITAFGNASFDKNILTIKNNFYNSSIAVRADFFNIFDNADFLNFSGSSSFSICVLHCSYENFNLNWISNYCHFTQFPLLDRLDSPQVYNGKSVNGYIGRKVTTSGQIDIFSVFIEDLTNDIFVSFQSDALVYVSLLPSKTSSYSAVIGHNNAVAVVRFTPTNLRKNYFFAGLANSVVCGAKVIKIMSDISIQKEENVVKSNTAPTFQFKEGFRYYDNTLSKKLIAKGFYELFNTYGIGGSSAASKTKVISNPFTEGTHYKVNVSNHGNVYLKFGFAKEETATAADFYITTTQIGTTPFEFDGVDTTEYPYLFLQCNENFAVILTVQEQKLKFVDLNGYLPVSTSGTFADKPAAADIYVGFKYFCTDKQTAEGATDGIEIIHKGSDVWVDALGRVVS